MFDARPKPAEQFDPAWIGVDLDGTLSYYVTGQGVDTIGEPIPLMLAQVKRWLEQGKRVKIVTARVASTQGSVIRVLQRQMVEEWCRQHVGRVLPVTAEKDHNMVELWDDRAVRVKQNTGVIDREGP